MIVGRAVRFDADLVESGPAIRRGKVFRNHVDDSTECVGAVEHARGAANDFDSLRQSRVN